MSAILKLVSLVISFTQYLVVLYLFLVIFSIIDKNPLSLSVNRQVDNIPVPTKKDTIALHGPKTLSLGLMRKRRRKKGKRNLKGIILPIFVKVNQ